MTKHRFKNLDEAVKVLRENGRAMTIRWLKPHLAGKSPEEQQKMIDAANKAFAPPEGGVPKLFELPPE